MVMQDTNETKPKRIPSLALNHFFLEDPSIIEIGVDEVGRGPMFGRVYTAAVILPKDDSFDHSLMKDSKKFHSKKKIEEVAEYIKQHCIAWHVSYEDEKTIDNINILQATQKSMHKSILATKQKYIDVCSSTDVDIATKKIQLLIDGNYFNPISFLNKQRGIIETMSHVCIEGGDNKYTSIAAASILAKVARDEYIDQMCVEYPELVEKYAIDSNKGYGSKKHMDGIKQHGITIWHRRTFGICKDYV
jgi:ribonuclease HII